MRAPFQVLVIPFRRTAAGTEFAILRRSDAGWWQFVAGGGEDEETPIQAARRETREEIGLSDAVQWIALDSMNTVPKSSFGAADSWAPDFYVVPEHCFAVDAGEHSIRLSREHTEFLWAQYDEACRVLMWDSNRNALWELNERLKDVEQSGCQGGLSVSGRIGRRKRLLEQDALGRTPLFYAAETGLEEDVMEMIFSLRGTGLGPTRLTLIATKDHSGLTAADVAEQNGHEQIARLLRVEQARMEYHE